ncbi:MAG: hypothetical protein ACREAB_19035 [Blastocatellia bacterium]
MTALAITHSGDHYPNNHPSRKASRLRFIGIKRMSLDTQIELIKFFTLVIWVLNAVIAGLIFIYVSVILWLCYAEGRQSKVHHRRSASSPQCAEHIIYKEKQQ